ncbi:protein adenylyltransferase SelO [Solimonas soli]|uniref:protein adenylyltransferase SelO n=1 Tax=Solimonas soli TaxID=413479 RepID=UPI0004B31EC4|nr:YdiU family protein [Solimonas soli]
MPDVPLPLTELAFDNRLAALGGGYAAQVRPAPLSRPRLLHANADVAALLDLDPAAFATATFTEVFAGNALLPGMAPIATLYAGHQFGTYVPQLGDGRAILLGQVRNARGESWDLQLKGAGQTPFSRFADGRAVLRSSVREYLAGEALHHLGIPTTRALSLVAGDDPVRRETIERAAVICRVAPSHIRFGHFEVFYYRDQHQRLAPLADHVIDEHFPHLRGAADRHARWLGEVIERTARLMAQWQSVGFCHGVMNTDNMSILGLTLDYGPYGFIDAFDAHHICNHSDDGGRYAYDRQPGIGLWNCSRLLQATLPLLHEDENEAVKIAEHLLERYGPAYSERVTALWRAKIGLREAREGDAELINRFLTLLHRGRADFTRSFRLLAQVASADGGDARALRDRLLAVEALDAWLPDYRARLRAEGSDDDAARAARMNAVNPKYVLRNHLAQRAIEDAERGSAGQIERLLTILRRPYDEQPEHEAYADEPPPEARHIEVSCSS